MRWDEEEELEESLPTKARRPRPDSIVGPASCNRHPAVQAEIERRVAIYARQVEQTGMITWLPSMGSGED
jgi:hypothetical protein